MEEQATVQQEPTEIVQEKTLAQPQMPKISRQARRAIEQKMVRRHLTKAERRFLRHTKNPLRREIFQETLRMVAEQFYATGTFGR